MCDILISTDKITIGRKKDMNYTPEDILSKCRSAMAEPNLFYKQDFVNYRGKFPNTNRYFNEAVAEFVLNNLTELTAGIPQITRQTTYKTPTHTGSHNKNTSRVEERIAMEMFIQRDFGFIGNMIDYQTPLKNSAYDEAGKIDLLAYNKQDNTLRLLELKKPDSAETMLRCTLEAYTYLKTVDQKKLLADFGLPENAAVKACPLVFVNGVQQEEWLDTVNRPKLHEFMETLDIMPYFVENVNGGYIITEG